ncbi:MAG: hypothetical protein M3531_26680, partial [Pseudomonadota bacterium]|nr:hypothetical protein [Pseudomonadota bacterium]
TCGGRGGRVAAEQAQKTNQNLDVLHGCFLVVVGTGTTRIVFLSRRTTMPYLPGSRKVKFVLG